jgi:hypothetical protein
MGDDNQPFLYLVVVFANLLFREWVWFLALHQRRVFTMVSSWAAGLHLALTFPSTLPLVRRHPKLVWMLYPLAYAVYISYQIISKVTIPNQLEWIGHWNRGDTLISMLLFLPSIIALVRQYRLHRSGPERQKIQLVVYSALFSGVAVMIFYLVPEFLGKPSIAVNIAGLLLLPFPLAIALAIWRYQLFDINVIIHRTLVYGALTLVSGLLYFTSVTVLQRLFTAISGQQSSISIVLSTLAIAALFNPLRLRIQNFIDRRFYRKRYNAEQALARFAAKARSETDIEQLSAEVLKLVKETLQPDQASIWLKK